MAGFQHQGTTRKAGAAAPQTQGSVASGATDSGNPVKIGAVFNTSLPIVTTGQRVDAQANGRGQLLVTNGPAAGIAGADGVANTSQALLHNGATNTDVLYQGMFNYRFNGTTWDRDRKPNATSRIPSAAASTNATSAKATAGDLWVISGVNASASVKYLKFYNKATAPTVGTDTPVLTLALPVGAFSFNLAGQYFATGIAFALTGAASDADTTALTAADVVGLTVTYA
jgi:hypothetical protein